MKTISILTIFGVFLAGVVFAVSTFSIKVGAKGTISETGTSVTVPVKVACPTGSNVMEAHLSVSQDSAFGFGAINPVCDNESHEYLVTVNSQGGSFVKGKAQASGYILICDSEFSNCNSVSSGRRIQLKQ
ncbi:MAG TPA: hypothetical protein VD998_00310 [Verrucomicrobiae bacterium]|nr:hypothetical protein [Verrucomicrobiae bacterium]